MAAWDSADLQMGTAGLHTSVLGTQPPCWPLGREEVWEDVWTCLQCPLWEERIRAYELTKL